MTFQWGPWAAGRPVNSFCVEGESDITEMVHSQCIIMLLNLNRSHKFSSSNVKQGLVGQRYTVHCQVQHADRNINNG